MKIYERKVIVARSCESVYIACMDKEYLSPEEVAELLSVTRRTVYNWLKSGRIPAMKIGGVWRVRRADLQPTKKEAA
jgi:excisionase family DNA binding protein